MLYNLYYLAISIYNYSYALYVILYTLYVILYTVHGRHGGERRAVGRRDDRRRRAAHPQRAEDRPPRDGRQGA